MELQFQFLYDLKGPEVSDELMLLETYKTIQDANLSRALGLSSGLSKIITEKQLEGMNTIIEKNISIDQNSKLFMRDLLDYLKSNGCKLLVTAT